MPKQNTEARSQNTEAAAPRAPIAPGMDIAAENAALKARIAEMESAKSRIASDEMLIAAKMTRGLRREQARAVIERQRAFDGKQIKN